MGTDPLGYNPLVNSPRSRSRSAWQWILVLPLIGLLFPGLYARSTPELFGFPFFYWYQVAWVLITGLLTAVAYFASERK
jgi:hypothetical protein